MIVSVDGSLVHTPAEATAALIKAGGEGMSLVLWGATSVLTVNKIENGSVGVTIGDLDADDNEPCGVRVVQVWGVDFMRASVYCATPSLQHRV